MTDVQKMLMEVADDVLQIMLQMAFDADCMRMVVYIQSEQIRRAGL